MAGRVIPRASYQWGPGDYQHLMGWPMSERDTDALMALQNEIGGETVEEGLFRRGYRSLRHVCPERRDSVLAGIRSDCAPALD